MEEKTCQIYLSVFTGCSHTRLKNLRADSEADALVFKRVLLKILLRKSVIFFIYLFLVMVSLCACA